jgi:hypothetical protein
MMDKNMTRKEFFKIAGLAIFTVLILPGVKKLNSFRKSHKEARYYENLAG